MSLRLRFWGVRGSIACPSPSHVRYGGNTSCLEVSAGDQSIILDAGTGIRPLGHSFMERGIKARLLYDIIDSLITQWTETSLSKDEVRKV